MPGAAPKSPKTGRAATPAPLPGATDNPEEKGASAPATQPPGEGSTAAAVPSPGLTPPQGSTDTSEQADDAAEASAAVDSTAGAPAALPSGAAAGVDDFSVDLSSQAEDVPAILRVKARVARRRAGIAWAAGEVREFNGDELSAAQCGQLMADPGFDLHLVPQVEGAAPIDLRAAGLELERGGVAGD